VKVERKKGTKLGLEVSDAKAGTLEGPIFLGRWASVKKSKLRIFHVFQYP
jgi:hypothetical protein